MIGISSRSASRSGDFLGLQVDDDHRIRDALHVGDAAEVVLELAQLGLHRHALLGGKQVQTATLLELAQLVQALDPLADRLEVGEQAAEPAPVHVRHLAALRPLLDRVTGLLLGPDEEDHPALRRHLRDELGRLLQQLLRLEEIDDVDPLPLPVDEAAHAWVPAPRLVTEMNPGLQQLLDAYVGHLTFLSLVWFEGAPQERPVRVSPVAAAGTRACPGSVPCLSAGVGCKVRRDCRRWVAWPRGASDGTARTS